MGKRSPILGYNHNISHRGLVFHVQTEDSGVDHPHIFTHLFYGGVIINSRKLDYDPEQAEGAVKSLMQAQHKASLKALKRGDFGDKIDRYFADDPKLQPRQAGGDAAVAVPADVGPEATIPMTEPPVEDTAAEVSAAFETLKQGEIETREPAAPLPTGYSQHHTGRVEKLGAPKGVHEQPTMPVTRAKRPSESKKPAGKIRRVAERERQRDRPVAKERRAAGGVVVQRPAVIIGAPAKVIGGRSGSAPSARARPRRFAREDSRSGIFGKDAVSEKSLDEVILAYLSEDGDE